MKRFGMKKETMLIEKQEKYQCYRQVKFGDINTLQLVGEILLSSQRIKEAKVPFYEKYLKNKQNNRRYKNKFKSFSIKMSELKQVKDILLKN